MAYDLLFQAPRGVLLSSDEKKELFEKFLLDTKLDNYCEITRFSDSLRGDSRSLQRLFAEGEFRRDEFEAFCVEYSLTPDASEEKEADMAARKFLDYKWGQNLFSPKMPHNDDEAKAAYRLIIEFARRHKLVVHDPQIGHDIDLDSPGDFPPMWGPRPIVEPPIRRWFQWRKS